NSPVPSKNVPTMSWRWFSYLLAVAAVALLSTLTGFFAARFQGAFRNWLKIHPVVAADSHQAAPALASTPQLHAKDSDVEAIAHLAPQQQAEHLLELAIKQPDLSLSLIHRNLTSWRGRLEDSDRLFRLVLQALWRLGALGNRGVEPTEAFHTLKLYAHHRNQEMRFWAVEGLAMLGNDKAIDELLDLLAHDRAAQIRQRAANGLSQSGLLTG